jgi:hypothetical protein
MSSRDRPGGASNGGSDMPIPNISDRINRDERLAEVSIDDRGVTVLKPLDLIPVLCTPGLVVGAAALGLAAEEAADN